MSAISFELADRHHTVAAFCGNDTEMLKKLKALLSTDYYHINITDDVAGLEMAVAMKNAYALGVTLESVAIARVVAEALKRRGKDLSKFPLLCHIYDMITKNITADVPWESFEKID